METCYPKEIIRNTLGEWVAKNGRTQFRVAETEKYPHVTFFLNGGAELPFEGETRDMPPSPKVATYDLQPEMSADISGCKSYVATLGDGGISLVSPSKGNSAPPFRKKVTCGYFSVSATRNWVLPFLATHSPSVFLIISFG